MPDIEPFYKRFNINLDHDAVEERFINRLYSGIFDELIPVNTDWKIRRLRSIGAKLGIMVNLRQGIAAMIERDKDNCLDSIEALYEDAVDQETNNIQCKPFIDQRLNAIFRDSEGDLGIEWRDGQFWRTGAKLLDEKLVNEDLKWLADQGLEHVYEPFEKALRDYSESISRPEKLRDVITDMHEALEAMAKIVTGKDQDLSGNREKFISQLNLTKFHREMLKLYIDYANRMFRHAQAPEAERNEIFNSEAENFIYFTGIYIRFAIEKLKEAGAS